MRLRSSVRRAPMPRDATHLRAVNVAVPDPGAPQPADGICDRSTLAAIVDPALVVVTEPDGQMAREMREARAMILGDRAVGDDRTPMLVLAGTRGGRGVGVVAANFAAASAQLGYRVLLVDANVAAPIQHDLFMRANGPGLVDLIDGGPDSLAAWSATQVPGLALMTAGAAGPDGESPFEHVSIYENLSRTARDFDLVVIDAGGGEPNTVAAIAARTDGVVVVVERHRSATRRVRRLLDGLAARSVPPLGTILID